MKTFTNRSKSVRTLARAWDDETGQFDYFWLTPEGKRRYRVVTTEAGTFDASSYLGLQVLRGEVPGRFSYRLADTPDNLWTQELAPGESARLPTYRETYHAHAMRTGEFRPHINRACAEES